MPSQAQGTLGPGALSESQQSFVTIPAIQRNGVPMGEVIDLGSGLEGLTGLLSGLVSLAALGIYALSQGNQENDDDDSNPGGGLMQPVA